VVVIGTKTTPIYVDFFQQKPHLHFQKKQNLSVHKSKPSKEHTLLKTSSYEY